MKRYESFTRSKSIDSKSHNISVSSILKDPSRSKMKHQRSVRFLEPESMSSEESVDKEICQQQSKKETTGISSSNMALSKSSLKSNNSSNYLKKIPSNDMSIMERFQGVKLNKPENRLKKVFLTKRSSKKKNSSISPKFEPKMINFDFRDQRFYEKLNKFIINKNSVSPERTPQKDIEESKLNICVSVASHMKTELLRQESVVIKGDSSHLTHHLVQKSPSKSTQQRRPRFLRPQSSNLLN